jgi:hypothetical protein
VQANQAASKLLHVIIHEVIRHRKTRAFFLQNDVRHPLIDNLFDARVLHVRKRNISASENPGVRYDVYKIDYGCYVDLLTSSEAPKGLFVFENPTTEQAEFIEVPPDDYRSIRRAVLDPIKLLQAEAVS